MYAFTLLEMTCLLQENELCITVEEIHKYMLLEVELMLTILFGGTFQNYEQQT